MKQPTNLELALCDGLPWGLKVMRPDKKTILLMKGINGDCIVFQKDGSPYETFGDIKKATPIMFSLDCLTKEITISDYNDKKPFVPLDKLRSIFSHPALWSNIKLIDRHLNGLPSNCCDLMDRMHFNRRNLKPDEFINAYELNVY